MKRFIAVQLCCLFGMSVMLSGCGTTPDPTQVPPAVTNDPNVTTIKIYAEAYSCMEYFEKFKESHPDFPYEFEAAGSDLIDVISEYDLADRLVNGTGVVPDICILYADNAYSFEQGEYAQYICSYEDLGIDVDTLVKEAGVEQCYVDIGTRKDGKLVGLGYTGATGAFAYRRSIAKEVWGTDDPAVIGQKIGGSWNNFLSAAEELKKKGYSIVSGVEDLWWAVNGSADTPWRVNGNVNIDPKREQYMDLAKTIRDNQCENGTKMWSDEWFLDMQDNGPRKVFGFFGAIGHINYTFTDYCGGEKVGEGTYGDWAVCEPPCHYNLPGNIVFVNKDCKVKEAVGEVVKWMTLDTSTTGFQYMTDHDKGEGVSLHTLMNKIDGTNDFLGGQNIYDVYGKEASKSGGKYFAGYECDIEARWKEEVEKYIDGNKTREQAIEDFKAEIERH